MIAQLNEKSVSSVSELPWLRDNTQTTLLYVRFLLVIKMFFIAILSKLAPVKVALASNCAHWQICILALLYYNAGFAQQWKCRTHPCTALMLMLGFFFLQMVHFFFMPHACLNIGTFVIKRVKMRK